MTDNSDDQRWRERPVLGALLQAFITLTPLVLGVVAGLAVARTVPEGWMGGRWLTWLLAAATATIVIAVTQPMLRRLLPLAWLLRLGMLWPGRAPSRFRLARRAGRLENVEGQLARARDRGLDGDPSDAAATVLSLVTALTAHDRRTRGHAERVRIFTDLVAVELGLGRDDRDRLRWASLLHDIGKLEVPESVLNKPGKPSSSEWAQLKAHPEAGDRILAPLRDWLGPWADATLHHHERWDGNGYPLGLAGTEISYAGRIVSVADAYEVMTAARAYKRPMGAAKAREELFACAGGQFDPAVVRAFLLIPLSRLRWALGPFSWVAQLPLARDAVHASGSLTAAQVSTAAGTAAGAAVIGMGQFAGHAPAHAWALPQPLLRAPTEQAADSDAGDGGAEVSDDRVIGEAEDALTPKAGRDVDDSSGEDDEPTTAPSPREPGGSSPPSDPDPDTDDGDEGGAEPEDDGDLIDPTLDTVDEIGGDLGDVVDDTTDTIGDAADGVGDAVGGEVEDTVGRVGEVVDDTGDALGDDTGDALGDVVEDAVDEATDPGDGPLGG
jgi:HD-GYP domain-containing protein (c-di-GMP phosphodiesterase class II)